LNASNSTIYYGQKTVNLTFSVTAETIEIGDSEDLTPYLISAGTLIYVG
jgi:hypothetical protein